MLDTSFISRAILHQRLVTLLLSRTWSTEEQVQFLYTHINLILTDEYIAASGAAP